MPLKHEDREIIVLGTLTIIILIIATLVGGCSIYQKHHVVVAMPAVATDHELICFALDNTQVGWGAAGVAFSALSGGASTVTATIDDKLTQDILVGSSVLFTAMATLSAYMQTHYVKQYTAAKCP